MYSKKIILFCLLIFSFNGLVNGQPGTLDLSFVPATGQDWSIWATAVQSDGKIIIAGEFVATNGLAEVNVSRLNTDGSVDTTFQPGLGAAGSFPIVTEIAIQPDGRIIFGGEFTSYNGTPRHGLVRIEQSGLIDSSFVPPTGANFGYIYAKSIQNDGKVIVAGDVLGGIVRLHTDGSLDATFDSGTGASVIGITSLQNDGKIIIGGSFTTYNGVLRRGVARLNTDGSLDTTFFTGTGANYSVYTLNIQNDGKIIIAGEFTTFNGLPSNYIVRLNTDGSIDPLFFTGSGANYHIVTTALQSDGKIIIGGIFTGYNGTPRNRIARLNTDGTLDAVFDPGTGPNDPVYTSSIQADGKVIIGGFFNSYNGINRNYVARVNALTTEITETFFDDFKIFPNPTDGITNISLDAIAKNVSVEVYNILGVRNADYYFENTNSIQLNLQLNTGIYLLEIRTNDNHVSRIKVVKN